MISKDTIQAEALAVLAGRKRSGLGIATGGGKTLIGLRHMSELYKAGDCFLVVAPRRSIFHSWETAARQFGLSYLLPFISFSTYVSLSKQSLNFKAVYLDECHSLLYSHANWLEQYDGIIVGLTGTPPRFSLSEKGQMVERYCPLVYTYFTDDAVLDGILNDYRIIVHHLKLDVEKTIKVVQQNTGRVWYTSEWEAYRYWDKRIELSKQETSPKDVKWL
jgi:superfamily II DNA or RNA helicase